MIWRILADAVLVLHLAFIVLVVLGGVLVLRDLRWAWLHLPAAAWGIAVELAGWFCPLTPLEKSLRLRGGEAGYEGGFIEHYLEPLIYPSGLTRGVELAIGLALLALNLALYVVALRRHRRGRSSR